MENKKNKNRTIVFYNDHFEEFFTRQNEKVKEKIIWTLQLIEELERIPGIYFKHLDGTSGLYEIRIQQGTDVFRIFCFFIKGPALVIINGFHKKTQRTPKKELDKAIKIKEEYEHYKA